jgi:CRISPR-associated protein Csc1
MSPVARPITPLRLTTENANACGDDYVQPNHPEKQINSPTGKIGTRIRIQPGARFCFFVMSFDGSKPDLPVYIRIGKKWTKALIEWTALSVQQKTGSFMMNHPVLVDDLARMPVGDLRFSRMIPFDVIEQGRFDGPFCTFSCSNGDPVQFPTDHRFLQRGRV